MKLRLVLSALLVGFLASVMRAPGGLDWTQAPLADPLSIALFGAAVLVMLGLVLRTTRALDGRGELVPLALLATSAGFALHALGFPHLLPESRTGFGLALMAASAAIWGLLRSAEQPANAGLAEARSWLTSLAWLVVGAGGALGIETLARRARQLTLGLPEENGLVVAVVLGLAALGARAFGTPLVKRAPTALAAAAWVAVPTGALAGLVFMNGLSMDGLHAYLSRFGYTSSEIGTAPVDALLGATTWILAAFALGVALVGSAEIRALPSVLFGAALTKLFLPFALSANAVVIPAAELGTSFLGWEWLARASVVVTVGVALALFAAHTRSSKSRTLVAIALVIATAAPIWFGPRPAAWSFSPWYKAPLTPTILIEGASGFATVEWAPGGGQIATLDRRRLTPTGQDRQSDSRMLAASLELVQQATLRVLIVGVLDPERDLVLRSRTGLSVDRTAPWFDVLEPLETALFAESGGSPIGTRVTPHEAKERISEGAYDLIVSLPIHGPVLRPRSAAVIPWGAPPAPVFGGLALPAGTLGVSWVAASATLSTRGGLGQTLLGGGDLRSLLIGRAIGDAPDSVLLFDQSTNVAPPSAWERLTTFPLIIGDRVTRANLARLQLSAEVGSRQQTVAQALEHFFAIQALSSPFETPADQVELDEEVLRGLWISTGKSGPTPFLHDVWTWLAWVLGEKRSADLSLVYLEPLSTSFGPWPVLDRVLAQAYRELMMPEEESATYERALAGQPNDVRLWEIAAQSALRAEDFDLAIERYRRALEMAPKPALERELGLTMLRAGRLEGRALLEAWLQGSPDDEAVRRALELEEFPPIEQNFTPQGGVLEH